MILFKTIEFENLLSVGNQSVTIPLNTHTTTLVHGVNGSGKSTILDALCYVLYGKAYRKINLPQLVNTQNKKGLLVSISFSIGQDDYIVRRGQKPKVFEIYKNDKLLDSNASDIDNQKHLEQNILKLNFKSFTQIVILGTSSFVPFMQLPAAGRRECVEEFLDIKVFSAMSMLAKSKLRMVEDATRKLEMDIDQEKFKHNLQQKRVTELSTQTDDKLNQLMDINNNLDFEISKCIIDIDSLRNKEQKELDKIEDLKKKFTFKKEMELFDISGKLSNKVDASQKVVEFYSNHDDCYTCSQHIPSELKDKQVSQHTAQIAEIHSAQRKIDKMIHQHQQRSDKIDEAQKIIQGIQNDIFKLETKMYSYNTQKQNNNKEISSLDNDTLELEEATLTSIENMIEHLEGEFETSSISQRDYEIVVSLLKDSGIKTHIVRKYIPLMNKFVQEYLKDLEFPIHFTLDEEFNETIQSPLYSDFSYSSFSEGQKSRIDLALLMTWRDVAKAKNSVSTNLIIFDETFSSSLDESGKYHLLNILRYKMKDTNVFVVDHTLDDDFKEKFDKTIKVTMVNGFSNYN